MKVSIDVKDMSNGRPKKWIAYIVGEDACRAYYDHYQDSLLTFSQFVDRLDTLDASLHVVYFKTKPQFKAFIAGASLCNDIVWIDSDDFSGLVGTDAANYYRTWKGGK